MISVCLATYNGEKYIKEQLDSILIQLEKDDEVITSDDHSTDNTVNIINSYNDSRIKIYENNKRKGVVGNFENALNQAKGDYIFLSDQDDVWLSGKVEKSLAVLKNADLVVSDCIVTDSRLNIIDNSFFVSRGSCPGFWKNLRKSSYLGACIAFRRDLLKIVMPFPANLPVLHDAWIASLADIAGKVIFLKEPLIYFRRHDENNSYTTGKSAFPLYKKVIYFRFYFLFLIIKRILKLKISKWNLYDRKNI